MAFWRFGFAQESGIDGLLKSWEPSSSSLSSSAGAPASGSGSSPSSASFSGGSTSQGPSASTSNPFVRSSPADPTAEADAATAPSLSAPAGSSQPSAGGTPAEPEEKPTLEQLLEEEDLLQECKTGHTKLLEYLSSPYAVHRMLAYISGEAFLGQPIPPPLLLQAPDGSTDAPSEPSDESKELMRKRMKYPYLCTEILNMDPWQVTETIFRDTHTYLVPFWNAILDKPSSELVEISVQVGHWAKINSVWLSNTRVPQMITFLRQLPNLFPRLLAHLPYVSPISDILNKLVTTDDAHPQLHVIDWLLQDQLISQTLELLDPSKHPIEAHGPAGDFLRGIVAAASAASATKQQQQQQAQAKIVDEAGGGGSGSPAMTEEMRLAWTGYPNNALVRELASEKTIETLLRYMLDVEPAPASEAGTPEGSTSEGTTTMATVRDVSPTMSPSSNAPEKAAESSGLSVDTGLATSPQSSFEAGSTAVTPTASTTGTTPTVSSFSNINQSESTSSVHQTSSRGTPTPSPAPPSRAAVTSSLLNSLTLIIDIIRKNNSDFTELQILQYLERANGGFDPEADEDEDLGGEGEGEEGFGAVGVMDQGPSLVDLSPLLVQVAKRLPDLHKLLLYPRSQITPIPTTLQGKKEQEPLTFERFRLCELYAELLHCSNMAILNRQIPSASPSTPVPSQKLASSMQLPVPIPPPTYDPKTGRISGTRKQAFERLSRALNTQQHPESAEVPTEHAQPNGFASTGRHDDVNSDEGMVEDISLEEDPSRPVTAQSDVTSSYTSGGSDGEGGRMRPTGSGSDGDVFDSIHATAAETSFDDDAASLHFAHSNPASASNSPMPPSTGTFGDVGGVPPSNSPAMKGSPLQGSAGASGSAKSPGDAPKVGPPQDGPGVASGQIAANATESRQPQPSPPVLPGIALKRAFIDLQVVPAVLDLFFAFPWNNFLHNVVYDLIQQIFNGKLDAGPNRELCLAAFGRGQQGLIPRVLDAIDENRRIISKPGGVRLGHMGHLTLISEEIVKLFYNNPRDILPHIPSESFHKMRWEAYVEGTLRETRERDLQPLGGGVSLGLQQSASAGGATSAIELDEEFPSAGQHAGNMYAGADEEMGEDGREGEAADKAHFARYLASQIHSEYAPSASNGHSNGDRAGQPRRASMSSSSSSSSDSSSDDNLSPAGAFGSSPTSASTARRQPPPGSTATGLDRAAANWFGNGSSSSRFDDDDEGGMGDSAFDDYDDDDDEDEDEGTSSGSRVMYGVGASSSRRSQHQDYDFALGNTSAGVPSSSASSTPSSAAQHLDQSRRIHNPAAGGARQERFGFDDRFDGGKFGNGDSSDEDDEDAESGGCALGRDDDDDDDDGFGPFSDNFAAAPSKGQASAGGFAFDDDFTGTSSSAAGQSNKGSSTSSVGEKAKLTPADWNSSFRAAGQASFGDFGDFASAGDDLLSPSSESGTGFGDEDDDFGDFESGTPTVEHDEESMHGDYDFSQTASATSDDSASARADPPPPRSSLVSPTLPALKSPARKTASPKRAPPIPVKPRRASLVRQPSAGPEVLGPGVHDGAHLSQDGKHVEAEVEMDGKVVTVQVPRDELALHPEMAAGSPETSPPRK